MYFNLNNVCLFEGRLSKDPEVSNVTSGSGNFTKVRATIVTSRTSKDKNPQFVDIEAIGAKADFIAKYFKKGSPIKVVASYKRYKYKNKENKDVYGHTFEVFDVNFTVNSSNSNNQENQDNQNNNFNNSFNNNDFNNNDFNNNGFGDAEYSYNNDEMPF